MIVDTSAIVAILLRESGHEILRQRILAADERWASAVTAVEVAVVMMARLPHRQRDEVAKASFEMIGRLGITIASLGEADAVGAAMLYAVQERGAGAAGLNLADVFVAALAQARNEPIPAHGTDEFTRAGLTQAP